MQRLTYLVLDRESIRNEEKLGLRQNFSLFKENSVLFDENNGELCPNPVFPQQNTSFLMKLYLLINPQLRTA